MKGVYDRAIADYDQALRIDPNSSMALKSRAKAIKRKTATGAAAPTAASSAPAEKDNQK